MILFHGSKRIIEKPYFQGSDIHNDYGPGFYLTADLESAKEWACKNNSVGFLNKYKISFSGLKVLDLTDKTKYSILNWMAILMHFRSLPNNFRTIFAERLIWLEKFYIDISNYDIVIGFRADDAYFSFPKEFISGNLSFEDLNIIYFLGNLGIQYTLVSEKAINKLHFVSATLVDEEYIGKHYANVELATIKFEEIIARPSNINHTTIMELMKND